MLGDFVHLQHFFAAMRNSKWSTRKTLFYTQAKCRYIGPVFDVKHFCIEWILHMPKLIAHTDHKTSKAKWNQMYKRVWIDKFCNRPHLSKFKMFANESESRLRD